MNVILHENPCKYPVLSVAYNLVQPLQESCSVPVVIEDGRFIDAPQHNVVQGQYLPGVGVA